MTKLLFHVHQGQRSPAGGMDMLDWFMQYKWKVAGEAYVPFPKGTTVQVGDELLFAVDGLLLGQTKVIQIFDDPINDRVEVWYRGEDVSQPDETALIPIDMPTGPFTVSPLERPVRPPSKEELEVLAVLEQDRTGLVLTPVLYRGQDRYALAVKKNVNDQEVLRILAICTNTELDRDQVVSMDGVVALAIDAVEVK